MEGRDTGLGGWSGWQCNNPNNVIMAWALKLYPS